MTRPSGNPLVRAVRSWATVLLVALLSACAAPVQSSSGAMARAADGPAVSGQPSTPPAARAAAAAYDYDMDIFHPVVAHHGMVATENRLASQAGLEILEAGGNAVDAAVAAGFTLAVTLPNAGNLGGGGFMMVHEAKTGQDIALDFREMAPARA